MDHMARQTGQWAKSICLDVHDLQKDIIRISLDEKEDTCVYSEWEDTDYSWINYWIILKKYSNWIDELQSKIKKEKERDTDQQQKKMDRLHQMKTDID